MRQATAEKTRVLELLCWCGADEDLETALHRSNLESLHVVRTASEFLELFSEQPLLLPHRMQPQRLHERNAFHALHANHVPRSICNVQYSSRSSLLKLAYSLLNAI